ncbi:hypothetical protein ACFO3U_01630 [Flavobacterium ponti]|uniref:Uncharacterized protein n=1 Tax=Flavobacterium ponti TaxID=665133 RepID=A0ABV9P223_9FLAO
MKLFCTLLLVFFANHLYVKNIEGKYKGYYKSKTGAYNSKSFEIVFDKLNYVKTFNDGEKVKGTKQQIKNSNNKSITYLYDFVFTQPVIKLDSLEIKMFGKPIIEINESKSDTLFFRTTYSGQLNVTINEGILVLIK